ncbi:MAG: hypothetical protein QXG05_05415 [Nitrososphaerota archaeon]
MILDAAAVNAVSKIVSHQNDWLSYQFSRVQVDPYMLLDKIRSSDIESLSRAFMSSVHLPASVRQIDSRRLKRAADYWIELTAWGKKESLEAIPELQIGLEEFELLTDDIEKELQSFASWLKEKVSNGPILYEDVLGNDGKERVKRAFLVSYLCSSGVISIRYDPSTSKYVIVQSSGIPDNSVAVVL